MNSRDRLLIGHQYLPPIEYFCLLSDYKNVVLENNEHFQKQTYRNRCYILGANNVNTLTIPVVKGNSKTLMKDVLIDYSMPWHKQHWRSIQSAYGKSPYFEFFREDFLTLYDNPSEHLFDFNMALFKICVKILSLDVNISVSEYFDNTPSKIAVMDARSLISPKINFEERGIYRPVKYLQVFGSEFKPNLSILDLIMNEGPNAATIVTNSLVKE